MRTQTLSQCRSRGHESRAQGFMDLVVGDQSKAMRHMFFAERQSAKPPKDVSGDAARHQESRCVRRGHDGWRYRHDLCEAGFPVTILEMTDEALDRGLGDDGERTGGVASKADGSPKKASPNGWPVSPGPPSMTISPIAISSLKRCSRRWMSSARYSASSTRSPSKALFWRPTHRI